MVFADPDALVSADWLAAHLEAPDVRVVDATWHLPTVDRDARTEYLERHIPGAVYFDIDDISDSDTDLPHMLPSPEKFSARVRKLGLGDGNRIIVYDGNGGFSAAARVWWMFRVFGHGDVAVLNGGLPKWMAEGHPTEDRLPAPTPRHFTAQMNHVLVRSLDQIRRNLVDKRDQVVDARSAERFQGIADEPRPAKKKGHVPGSLNLPYPDLMSPDDHFVMRPADEIKAAFDAAGLEPGKPVVASCGSGVTAAVIALGLYLIGDENGAVYDGSWAEWGNRDDTPVTA